MTSKFVYEDGRMDNGETQHVFDWVFAGCYKLELP